MSDYTQVEIDAYNKLKLLAEEAEVLASDLSYANSRYYLLLDYINNPTGANEQNIQESFVMAQSKMNYLKKIEWEEIAVKAHESRYHEVLDQIEHLNKLNRYLLEKLMKAELNNV